MIKTKKNKRKTNLLVELEILNDPKYLIQNILEFLKKNDVKVIKLVNLIN